LLVQGAEFGTDIKDIKIDIRLFSHGNLKDDDFSILKVDEKELTINFMATKKIKKKQIISDHNYFYLGIQALRFNSNISKLIAVAKVLNKNCFFK
jgi:hypothetical protein